MMLGTGPVTDNIPDGGSYHPGTVTGSYNSLMRQPAQSLSAQSHS
jgi:hypothetical protein